MFDEKAYTVGLSLEDFASLLHKIAINTLRVGFFYENNIIRIKCGATTCLELKLVAISEHETQFVATHIEDCNFVLPELGVHLQNELSKMSIAVSSK